jgi:hypothetical protein
MAVLLKKFISVVHHQSIPRNDDHVDEDHTNYSFAMEYSGPPISRDIPRAVPIDFDQIPIAAAALASASTFNYNSLPVIQPIVKGNPLDKKLLRKPKSGFNSVLDNSDCEQAIQIGGTLSCVNGIECASEKLPEEKGSSLCCENGESPTILDEHQSSVGCMTGQEERQSEISQKKDDFETQRNNSESAQSDPGSSSPSVSSEIFSGQEDCDNTTTTTPCHIKRPSVVTFRDPEPSDTLHEESDSSEAANIYIQPKVERKGKKGSCYRCLKGNQFIEKREICIVCSAKYCASCVLRAMGSMPEGRKCVTCIGHRIDESKRKILGKCSRMLKRLLSELEVQHVMRSEISCATNQLPPEFVYVNGEALSLEELLQLQKCPNPPYKLTHGYYWYDKVSGYWGKVGKKPYQIISPQLKVGQEMKKDASNGNTNIMINGREITQKELWVLQAAGVECEGKPSFWLSADGSYQEEGQKNVKGRIWDKTRVKIVSAMLSLPFPSDSVISDEQQVNGNSPNYGPQKTLKKFLLVGDDKSGTSTIYKQAKLHYEVPFTEDERQSVKLVIQRNLYSYVAILLQGRQQFEEESLIDIRKNRSVDEPGPSGENDKTIYSIGPRMKSFSDWLIQVHTSGNLEKIFPAATREYAPRIEDLMRDAAFQATYARMSELKMLPRFATYFVERAVEISRENYEPLDIDILNADGPTSSNGLSWMEFSFPNSIHESCNEEEDYQNDSLLRYQLIRVHPRSLSGNRKWLEMLADVDIIMFSVSLTDYDEFSVDSNGEITNKMMESKKLFENIVTHPAFKEKTFLLLLNKFDLLEEKLKNIPLSKCEWFHDFNPVISSQYSNNSNTRSSRSTNATMAQRAFHYTAVKFKRLFETLSGCKLFVSAVSGLVPSSVDEALGYAREILKWYEEERVSVNNMELSSYEASTSS